MVINGHQPTFIRTHDGWQSRLNLAEWPANLPLPTDVAVVSLGENHEIPVPPYLRLVFASDEMAEILGGWFRTNPSMSETQSWFKTQLAKHGWQLERETPPDVLLPECVFHHPDTQARIRLSLQWMEALKKTTIIFQRVIKCSVAPSNTDELSTSLPLPADLPQPA